MFLRLLVTFLACVVSSGSAFAQQARYNVPRTADGRPDLQGVWATEFLTMLERPPGVENLVATPEQAQTLVAGIRKQLLSGVTDPDFILHDISQLAIVKGEYRTSMIVDPKDGRMPFTKAGLDLVARVRARDRQQFDGPEQRPWAERCLENLSYPPIRTVPVFLPHQVVQTRDYVVMSSEDAPGLRLIHLRGAPPPDMVRSMAGYSSGRWEGDTLVVQTTHMRTDDPARTVVGRPVLLSRASKITERFTRISPTELFYQFTVEDPELYTQAWTGEFSLTRHDGLMYEYACHEGNYSLPNILRGGQAEAARQAETKREPK